MAQAQRLYARDLPDLQHNKMMTSEGMKGVSDLDRSQRLKSTMAQVRFNQESTERQYNLADQAKSLGWMPEQIRILDGDLAQSGELTTKRDDFKTLVSDVAMGQVGAIFSLESSRLARSNKDWHRLLELCAVTKTLVFDGDGCYDPSDFNDSLVLGMKGTFAQAEL